MFYETIILGEHRVPPAPATEPAANELTREQLLAQIDAVKAEIEAKRAALPKPAPVEVVGVEAQLAAERAKFIPTDASESVAEVARPSGAVVVKKNHAMPKAQAGRKYVLLSKSLANWGKVPQQQQDLATILASNFEVGVEVAEDEVFAKVVEHASSYPSLASSVQNPAYVMKYYLGLDKRDGRHAGFIRRGFVQVRG
jgi:hypothetical protein